MKLGVNLDDLLICQPNNGEEALDVADNLIRGGIDVIVVDSVAALVPKAEIAGEVGDHHIALQARLMSQACRILTATMANAGTLVIFINQIRHKVGIIFGSPEVTTGGMALKFYSSIRLEIRKSGMIKDGDELVGHTIRVKVVKNKLASPFKTATFDMMFGEGISRIGEILDLSASQGHLKKSGAWYSYKDRNFAQGREKAKLYLKKNVEMMAELEQKILQTFKEEKDSKIKSKEGGLESDDDFSEDSSAEPSIPPSTAKK
uniref:DNA recombination/repair protein RecA n=1 Tax=Hirondellea gigas TaxID=1518452 RepID=A0A6A7G8N8_9CRUS